MAHRSRAPWKSVLRISIGCAWASISALAQAQAFELKAEVVHCEGCHGPSGRADVMQNNGRIAGQNQAYLLYILRQYRAGQLAGVNAAIMTYAVKQFSDGDLRALASYYSQLQ
jgi:cytochrome c553